MGVPQFLSISSLIVEVQDLAAVNIRWQLLTSSHAFSTGRCLLAFAVTQSRELSTALSKLKIVFCVVYIYISYLVQTKFFG